MRTSVRLMDFRVHCGMGLTNYVKDSCLQVSCVNTYGVS